VAEQHASAAERLQGHLDRFAQTWKDDVEHDKKSQEAYVQMQRVLVEKKSEALLKSVQSQIEELVRVNSLRGDKYLKDMEGVAKQRQANVVDFAETTETTLGTLKGTIGETVGYMVTSQLNPTLALAQGVENQLKEMHKPAHAAAVAKVDAEAKKLLTGLEAATTAADVKMRETLQSGAEVIKSIEAEMSKVEALLQSKGVGVSNAMAAAGEAASARLTSQSQAFTELVQSSLAEPIAAGVASVVAQVGQSATVVSSYGAVAGQVAAPTKTTPKKREYSAPGALSATRPHAEIMAQVGARDLGGEEMVVEEVKGENASVGMAVAEHTQVQEPAGEEQQEQEQEQQEAEAPVPMAISNSSTMTTAPAEKRALPIEEEATAAAAEATVDETSPSKKMRLSAGGGREPAARDGGGAGEV
jgi:hypothetical protein